MNVQRSPVERAPSLDRLLAIFLVILPFIPVALNVTTYRYLHLDYSVTSHIQLYALAVFLALIIVGWTKGFPRWVYPYLTIIVTLILAVFIMNDSDMTFWENALFKLMALGPLALLFAALWFFLRKKHPFRRLFQNMRSDWTLFAFCIYSLLIIAIQGLFTDIRSTYGMPFLYISTVLGMFGAGSYIALSRKTERIGTLIACLTLVWLVMGVGSATFWDGRQERWMETPASAWRLLAQYALAWGIMLFLMLLPAIISRIKQILKPA